MNLTVFCFSFVLIMLVVRNLKTASHLLWPIIIIIYTISFKGLHTDWPMLLRLYNTYSHVRGHGRGHEKLTYCRHVHERPRWTSRGLWKPKALTEQFIEEWVKMKNGRDSICSVAPKAKHMHSIIVAGVRTEHLLPIGISTNNSIAAS